MDKKLIDSYLDNIAELVVDEDKIVTYKSLSKSLGIHVNTAKQLLHTYLNQQKTQNVFPISATYLLAGKLGDGSFNITIVNESDVETTSSKFVEITSEHVYSVQKGKNVKEINMLCGVDKGTQESSSLVITSSKCVRKSKDEVKKKPESSDQENKEAIKKAFTTEKETKVESPVEKEIIKSPKKVSPKKQKEKSLGNVTKAGNIASLFAKVAQKNAEKPKTVENKEKKQSNVSASKEIEIVKTIREEKIVTEENVRDILSSDDDFEVIQPKKGKKSTPKGSPRKKKGSKRKRIRLGSDSDESESNDEKKPPETPVEEEKEEDAPPVSVILEDDEEPNESQTRKKRKKRKIVDKTVMHEDGYLETKKEVIFETDSDEEEEQPKKETKPNSSSQPTTKSKPSPSNAPKKQSTLLTFFKKR